MYGCERWTIKKAECQRIDAFEHQFKKRKVLRVLWTARRSNQSNSKGNPSWIFIGRTDVEAEAPVLWPRDVKNWLIWEDPDGGKDWRQEEKGTTEDEMVGWHHQLNGHEFEQAPGVGDGHGCLACCGPWSHKEWDMTERLKWTIELVCGVYFCCCLFILFILCFLLQGLVLFFFHLFLLVGG